MGLATWLGSHDAIAAALLGTVLGANLTYFTDLGHRRRQRRVIAMRIATDLRQWMNRVSARISDTRTHFESDGAGGTEYREVPDFRFEDDLNQVPLLDAKIAKRVFQLIHQKDAVNAAVEATLEYQDEDDALDVYLGRSANLFLTAMAVYDDLSQHVGWYEKPFSEVKKTMQSEVDRLAEIEAERVAFNRGVFADLDPAIS